MAQVHCENEWINKNKLLKWRITMLKMLNGGKQSRWLFKAWSRSRTRPTTVEQFSFFCDAWRLLGIINIKYACIPSVANKHHKNMAAKATHVSHLVENILTYYTQMKTTQRNIWVVLSTCHERTQALELVWNRARGSRSKSNQLNTFRCGVGDVTNTFPI